MSFAAALMFVCFFGWAAIGMPIGLAMIASGFLYLLLAGQDVGRNGQILARGCRVLGLDEHVAVEGDDARRRHKAARAGRDGFDHQVVRVAVGNVARRGAGCKLVHVIGGRRRN